MSKLTAYDKFVQQALKYGFPGFGLPKTGQTIVYQTGDDGYYKKGGPASGPRFVDNGDGTLTDRCTALMWVKDGTGAGCNAGSTLSWSNAILFCNTLSFAGHADWRLPNINELHSLVSFSRVHPCIDPLFIHTYSANYRSSTTDANLASSAWCIDFSIAEQLADYWILKSSTAYIRPVRSL